MGISAVVVCAVDLVAAGGWSFGFAAGAWRLGWIHSSGVVWFADFCAGGAACGADQ